MKLPDFSGIFAPKLPAPPDLRKEICATTTSMAIRTVGKILSDESSIIGVQSHRDPAGAAERIRKLSLEISNALVRAAADCDAEDARRKFADIPSKFAFTPTVKLHEPESDDGIESPIEPVGASVRGVPVPQSNRTGA